MADFDKLNRQTRDYNSRNVDRFNSAVSTQKASAFWLNYYNNQTYKQNNGQYSSHYSTKG